MNTTIITSQMLILGSTGSPPYCLVPAVRSADVGNASRQASARIMPERRASEKRARGARLCAADTPDPLPAAPL